MTDYPGACDNTLLIASRAKITIPMGDFLLPRFPVPEGHTEESYLRELVEAGARERYGDVLSAEVRERVEYELRVIAEMGFPAYFLIVWDLIRYAREQGIRTGPGRGSAAGSIIAYCLRITDLDPIEYGLIFERFLNPGRREMPDIDMDFDERYRSDVIRYCTERYGSDHVAQIITFSTIKGRQAIRDAARVLGFPYGKGDKLAKLMPPCHPRCRGHPPAVPDRSRQGGRPGHPGLLLGGRRAAGRDRRRRRIAPGGRDGAGPRGPAPAGLDSRRRGGDCTHPAHRDRAPAAEG